VRQHYLNGGWTAWLQRQHFPITENDALKRVKPLLKLQLRGRAGRGATEARTQTPGGWGGGSSIRFSGWAKSNPFYADCRRSRNSLHGSYGFTHRQSGRRLDCRTTQPFLTEFNGTSALPQQTRRKKQRRQAADALAELSVLDEPVINFGKSHSRPFMNMWR